MTASAEALTGADETQALRAAADWTVLPRAHGRALIGGSIRMAPDDFVVIETLPFELAGTGEHLYLRVRKSGDNTRWVARQLAAAYGVPPVAVGYAGLKDRHATTEQWFSVHLPGRPDDQPAVPRVEVLERNRHTGKLRVGAVAGNRFRIRVRGVSGDDDARLELGARLGRVASRGVPNYFGPQRFGHDAGNLELLEKAGRASRDARAFGLSALRSALFNGYLATRVTDETWDRALDGDIAAREAWPAAGLLWGAGVSHASGAVAAREQDWFGAFPRTCALLEAWDVRLSRRALGVLPDGLRWTLDADVLSVEFGLPKGAYATALLRELGDFDDAGSVRAAEPPC